VSSICVVKERDQWLACVTMEVILRAPLSVLISCAIFVCEVAMVKYCHPPKPWALKLPFYSKYCYKISVYIPHFSILIT
jgi:hypothetical protein